MVCLPIRTFSVHKCFYKCRRHALTKWTSLAQPHSQVERSKRKSYEIIEQLGGCTQFMVNAIRFTSLFSLSVSIINGSPVGLRLNWTLTAWIYATRSVHRRAAVWFLFVLACNSAHWWTPQTELRLFLDWRIFLLQTSFHNWENEKHWKIRDMCWGGVAYVLSQSFSLSSLEIHTALVFFLVMHSLKNWT